MGHLNTGATGADDSDTSCSTTMNGVMAAAAATAPVVSVTSATAPNKSVPAFQTTHQDEKKNFICKDSRDESEIPSAYVQHGEDDDDDDDVEDWGEERKLLGDTPISQRRGPCWGQRWHRNAAYIERLRVRGMMFSRIMFVLALGFLVIAGFQFHKAWRSWKMRDRGQKIAHNHCWLPSGTRRVMTADDPITGTFELCDSIFLKTASGSIDVDIVPKEGCKDHPVLSVTSISGSISVRFPPPQTPTLAKQDYRTTVASTNGSISGLFPAGSHTSFRTISSPIDVKIYILNVSAPLMLETHTFVGDTHLRVLDENKADKSIETRETGVISALSAQHTSASGSIHAAYPLTWRGEMSAESGTGWLEIIKDGVRMVGATGPAGISLWAGDGPAKIRGKTASGNTSFLLG